MQGHPGSHSTVDLPVRVNHNSLGWGQHCKYRVEVRYTSGLSEGFRGGEINGQMRLSHWLEPIAKTTDSEALVSGPTKLMSGNAVSVQPVPWGDEVSSNSLACRLPEAGSSPSLPLSLGH